MATDLGTAAYKLVLDAREFGANAAMSGRQMRDVQAVMRQTTTPAERMAASYDRVTDAWRKGQIPAQNYKRYLDQLNAAANKNSDAIKNMTAQYASGLPVVGRYVSMIASVPPPAMAAAAAVAAVAIAVTATAKAISFSTQQISEQFKEIDKIAKLAKATGFDPGSLIGLDWAAEDIAGVDAEVANKSLAIFVRRIGEVQLGAGEAEKAFARLGLSAQQLATMTPTEALMKVSERFREVETTSEKAAIAQQLFGRAGASLLPMLDAGSEAMMKFIEEAERLGIAFTAKDAEAIERYNDAWGKIELTFSGIWRQITIQIAPAMAALAEHLKDVITSEQGMQHLRDAITEISSGIRAAVRVAAEFERTWLAIRLATLNAQKQGNEFVGSLQLSSKAAQEFRDRVTSINRQIVEVGVQWEQATERVENYNKAVASPPPSNSKAVPPVVEDEAAREKEMQAITQLADRYREQIETYGMAAREAELYRAAREAVTDEKREAVEVARQLSAELDAMAAGEQAMNDWLKGQEDRLSDAQREWEKFSQEVERERERAFGAASKAVEALKTPEEKYIDTVKELMDWLDLGALSIEQFARLKANAAAELAKDMRVGKVVVDDIEAQTFGSAEMYRDIRRQQIVAAQAANRPIGPDTGGLDRIAAQQRTSLMQPATPARTETPTELTNRLHGTGQYKDPWSLWEAIAEHTRAMAQDTPVVKVAAETI